MVTYFWSGVERWEKKKPSPTHLFCKENINSHKNKYTHIHTMILKNWPHYCCHCCCCHKVSAPSPLPFPQTAPLFQNNIKIKKIRKINSKNKTIVLPPCHLYDMLLDCLPSDDDPCRRPGASILDVLGLVKKQTLLPGSKYHALSHTVSCCLKLFYYFFFGIFF